MPAARRVPAHWAAACGAVIGLCGCSPSPPPADATAQVFAPGIISTGNVFRGTFSSDGREFYFFRSVADTGESYRIFRSARTDTGWTVPDTVLLGAPASDLYPTVDPVTGHLLFASYRPAPGDTTPHPSAYLWEAPRAGRGWGEPRFLQTVSAYGYYHPQPSFYRENCLSIRRLTWDYREPMQWASRRTAAGFTVPDSSRAWLELRHRMTDHVLSDLTPGHDGTYVILVLSPRAPGQNRPGGPPDLYVSWRLRDGRYSDPRPLAGNVNTAGTENFAFFSHDYQQLYFVRDFAAIYHVRRSAALGERPADAAEEGSCDL